MGQIPLVTLTTDFGTADGYVGTMKGVILGIAPIAQLVDISHEIAPQDVRQAAYVLYTAYPFFPPHTVHLVVVDPGVGGARRAIALRTPKGCFVGPDNGVFSYVMACEQVEALVELAIPRYRLPQVSHTFHGRDVFAPAAAHLAAGIPITTLGPPVRDPATFPPPRLEITGDSITGEVLHADRFGNVITSIGLLVWSGDELSLAPAFQQAVDGVEKEQMRFKVGEATVVMAGQEIAGVDRTYAEVEPGETLALVGSEGHLEIAVREGNAAKRLGLHPGDVVTLRLR
ncbi:MAG: S-adenosyl-l-methionine hydroxide adenosyltransferase family protein [Anaerolineae bacterium]